MPFETRGEEPLDAVMNIRVTQAEKFRLQEEAREAKLTPSVLGRRRLLGRAVLSRTDKAVIAELRKLGGLAKHLHNESEGAYRKETAQLLRDIDALVRSLLRQAE